MGSCRGVSLRAGRRHRGRGDLKTAAKLGILKKIDGKEEKNESERSQ